MAILFGCFSRGVPTEIVSWCALSPVIMGTKPASQMRVEMCTNTNHPWSAKIECLPQLNANTNTNKNTNTNNVWWTKLTVWTKYLPPAGGNSPAVILVGTKPASNVF